MNNTWWVKQQQLDEKQRGVIDLPLTKSHLITGPPGSGKTNLLLLRGSQMVLSGKQNVLIVVFTRTLREFIATGCPNYTFGADKIKTLSSWSYEFMRENGIKPTKESDFESQRRANVKQITEIIAKRKLSSAYDAIILDEAQDYLPEELEAFFALGNVVFAAADGRQRIYPNETDGVVNLNKYFKNIYPLTHHYRNGHKICLVADELAKSWREYDPLMSTTNYDEMHFPSSVLINSCTDLNEQVTKALEAIKVQLKAYPDEQLAIICPKSVLSVVWADIARSRLVKQAVLQSAETGYVPFETGKPICVCSVHSAKGLEFRTVHLLDAENLGKSPLRRNITYTAVTRAKTSLSIYHCKPIPGYLDQALNVVRPPLPTAKLEQLFSKS